LYSYQFGVFAIIILPAHRTIRLFQRTITGHWIELPAVNNS
jgi:hypothetical protein